MARATTRTLLSLDRFAALIGFDPLHFNQVISALRPAGVCSDVVYQHNWQQPAMAGREEIARAIKQAEDDIRDYIGFSVLPDWHRDERRVATRLLTRESYGSGRNVRGMAKSVAAKYGHYLAGGQRVKTLLGASRAVGYTDPDGDGYDDRGTATVATSITDACEIRAYFPGESGADGWEIRPIDVTFAGGTATIRIPAWQLIDPTLWEALDAGATGAIDGDASGNYITEIDVYRVWHDPQQQVQFLWEPENCSNCNGTGCVQCEGATQYGCLTARDETLGFVSYRPATWNATTEEFDSAEWAGCREPDRMRLWYRAGWQDENQACPTLTIDPYWERTIALLALAYVQGDICTCTAVKTFYNYAQTDLALNDGTSEKSYTFTRLMEKCPWGTKRGAVEAFQRCNAEGRRNAR